jgi:hypothetical protein
MVEVTEHLQLHNLRIHYVTIRSELKYLIGAKPVGTIKYKPRSGLNVHNNPWFYDRSGKQPPKTEQIRILDGSGTKPNQLSNQNTNSLLTLSVGHSVRNLVIELIEVLQLVTHLPKGACNRCECLTRNVSNETNGLVN